MNLQEFQAYQEKEEKLQDLMEQAKYLRAESRRHFPARARNNEYETRRWKNEIKRVQELLSPVERELSVLKSEVFKLRKIASLGVGEWTREPNKEKNLGGSTVHYNHPEFGRVSHYGFGGWSMQRVAASHSVEWTYNGKTYRKHWSGGNARTSAYAYLKNVFGI